MRKLSRYHIDMLIKWCKYIPLPIESEKDASDSKDSDSENCTEYDDYNRVDALHACGMGVRDDVLGLLRYFKITGVEFIDKLIDTFNSNIYVKDDVIIDYLYKNNYTLAKLADIIEIKMKESSEDIITLPDMPPP